VKRSIDLNADVGESFGAYAMGDDAALLELVTSVNVACGFHAGDPRVMDRTVAAAARAGVVVGAHPGYWDLRGFGRRELPVDPGEIETDLLYQVGALAAFARAHGVALAHVKPHGALYNQAARDEAAARAVVRGVARAGRSLTLVGLASSELLRRIAAEAGIRFAAEAFVDRAYQADGSLAPRSRPGAVITDPQAAAAQAVRLAREQRVAGLDGAEIVVEADTLCLHGDNPRALDVARAVRAALAGAGVTVQAAGAARGHGG